MPADSKPTVTEPQQPQATATRKPARSTGPVIMVAGLFLAVATVLFIPMMAGGATSASSTAPVSSTVETAKGYQNVAEAAEELGFTPALPTLPDSAGISAITVLDGKVLEIAYTVNGGTIVYRTAQGADDLSGDYTEYAYTAIDETGGVTRSFAGASEKKLHLAVWASEGCSYSLSAPSGVDGETLYAIAQSIA